MNDTGQLWKKPQPVEPIQSKSLTEKKIEAFEGVLVEIGSALSDIVVLLERPNQEPNTKTSDGLLAEIGTALSDMVALLEQPKEVAGADIPNALKAIAEALHSLKSSPANIDVAAPVVNVAAPNVTVEVPKSDVQVLVQPAAVHVMDRPRVKEWIVDHTYFNGRIEQSRLRPVYEVSAEVSQLPSA